MVRASAERMYHLAGSLAVQMETMLRKDPALAMDAISGKAPSTLMAAFKCYLAGRKY
jgi:hypothetical protein